MKLPVRPGGALTPPDTLYIMKNPFDDRYEIVADTMVTYEHYRGTGELTRMLEQMIEYGDLPKEADAKA